MSSILFTADEHYNHANIMKYTGRPWFNPDTDLVPAGPGTPVAKRAWVSQEVAVARAAHMNEVLLQFANERIKSDDTHVHVGDFCCYGRERGTDGLRLAPSAIEERLAGKAVFVKGNHDNSNRLKHAFNHVELEFAHKRVLCVHAPPDSVALLYAYNSPDIVVCGHVHTAWSERVVETLDGRAIPIVNCGVDVRNYRPMTIDDVLNAARKATAAWQRRKAAIT